MDEDALKEEYFHIQKVVEDFDAKELTIKAWSVTLSMAGIGAAYFQGKPFILLLAAISALLFWLIEGYWKTFQYAYYARIWDIENYASGKKADIEALQISTAWSNSWHAGGTKRLLRALAWPHVALPHVAIFGGGVGLYVLGRYGYGF